MVTKVGLKTDYKTGYNSNKAILPNESFILNWDDGSGSTDWNNLSQVEKDFLDAIRLEYSNYIRDYNTKARLGGTTLSDRLKMALLSTYFKTILRYYQRIASNYFYIVDENFYTASELWNIVQKFNLICNSTHYIGGDFNFNYNDDYN